MTAPRRHRSVVMLRAGPLSNELQAQMEWSWGEFFQPFFQHKKLEKNVGKDVPKLGFVEFLVRKKNEGNWEL